MSLVPSPTWDDLDTTNWDRLWTWDDPMATARLDEAYALGAVVRDGAKLTIDWGSGEVTEGLISPIARDLFDRVTASGFGTATSGQAWTVSHSGNTSTDGDNALISAGAVNTAYFAYLAGLSSIDFDLTIKVSIPVIAAGAKISWHLVGRGQDTSNHVRFRLDFNTDAIIGWGIESVAGGTATALSSGLADNMTHEAGAAYWIRAQGLDSLLKIKVWRDGELQPFEWTGTATDSVYTGLPGWVGMMFLLATGNSNTLPVVGTAYAFYVGLTNVFDAGGLSTGLSLDDGMPTAVTNTSAIGVNEATGALAGPIGTDAGTYFSTFRTEQPWWDLPRDVAGVTISASTVASDGVRETRVFTGQMEDVPTDGRDAGLKAVSHTRLLLSERVQPPAVHGYYEGCEATWPISYALFQSGVYVAPPVLEGCRLYVPFHGSTHPFIPNTNGFGGFPLGWLRGSDGVPQSYQTPNFVDGPFLAGLNAQIDAVESNRLGLRSAGFLMAPGADMWSQTANAGRFEFWVRADPTDLALSEDPSLVYVTNVIFQNGGGSRFVQVSIGAVNRKPQIFLKDGVNILFATQPPLPSDGQWHFIAGGWDLANNKVRLRVDDRTDSYTAGSLSIANLPLTDDVTPSNISSYLPIAELRITTGTWAAPHLGSWANEWTPDHASVIMRQSLLTLEGLAETEAREAHEYISDFARSELATTGFNELDQFMYLPLPYWAEAEQQLTWEELSTDDNLGPDLRITRPVNKSYNKVDVAYKSSAAQENFSAVYSTSQLIQLNPNATLVLEVALAVPTIEIRSSTFSVLTGPALEATPPSASNAINYVTLNTEQDGSGTYALSTQVTVTVLSWTPGSAVVQFRNLGSQRWYVANNVSLPPFGIAGKAFLVTDAVATYQMDSSIALRGTRLLPADMPAIQSAGDARSMALALVSRLYKPRMEFTSSAFADPRRKPGQLVTVSDPDQTSVEASFRLDGVTLSQDGADVQQSVSGHEDLPVMVWGEGVWGETIWGAGDG